MALGKHQKTSSGRIRRKRGDSLAKNLKQVYSEFEKVQAIRAWTRWLTAARTSMVWTAATVARTLRKTLRSTPNLPAARPVHPGFGLQ